MANGGQVKGWRWVLCFRALSAHERMVRLPSSQMTEVATVATSGFAVGIRT